MKKIFTPVLLILSCSYFYSKRGIRTSNTGVTTINNVNVVSLLVYNITPVSDGTLGYYSN